MSILTSPRIWIGHILSYIDLKWNDPKQKNMNHYRGGSRTFVEGGRGGGGLTPISLAISRAGGGGGGFYP